MTFTWSEAPADFDTPLDLTDPASYQGIIPVVRFNKDGVDDEEADSPDAAYWTRALAPMSIGAWIKLNAVGSAILAKSDAVGNNREWLFEIEGGGALDIILYDEDHASNERIRTTADSALATGVWVFVVATYDGSANATGLNLYQDGALVASTDLDEAGFASMRDKGSTVMLAHYNATPAGLFDGWMAGGPLGLFFVQKELSADEALRLYEIGRRSLGL